MYAKITTKVILIFVLGAASILGSALQAQAWDVTVSNPTQYQVKLAVWKDKLFTPNPFKEKSL